MRLVFWFYGYWFFLDIVFVILTFLYIYVRVIEAVGMKAKEHSLVLMPVLFTCLKDTSSMVTKQSIVSGMKIYCGVLEELSYQVTCLLIVLHLLLLLYLVDWAFMQHRLVSLWSLIMVVNLLRRSLVSSSLIPPQKKVWSLQCESCALGHLICFLMF